MSEVSELKLNLITAISSSDQEEIVASLLYSQGCNIIYLAIELSASLIISNHHNLRPLGLSKVNQIPASELGKTLEKFGKDQLIIDGGSTTSLTKILADRRVNAQWLSQSISCSRYLVYIVKSGDNGMIYLSEFISDFNNLINAPMLICVLNQQRFDRYGQVIQKRFNDLASFYPIFALPYDIGASRAMNSSQSKYKYWRNNAFSNQIAKIGNHLK